MTNEAKKEAKEKFKQKIAFKKIKLFRQRNEEKRPSEELDLNICK